MNLMKPIAIKKIEQSAEWLYEVKYDGFRTRLVWTENIMKLISKNNIDLSANFPEIITYCREIHSNVAKYLPVQLDGELVILNNKYQANFALIQKRGRLKAGHRIEKMASERPATLMIFDILEMKGKSLSNKNLLERKSLLQKFFSNTVENARIQLVESFSNYDEISRIIFEHKSEGIVAKRKNSKYISGKKHHDWLKEKNWRKIHAFLTTYNPNNDYFEISVYHDGNVMRIGNCKHGLDEETFSTVKEIFMKNGEKIKGTYRLPPAICAEILTLDLISGELREPQFSAILPEEKALDCTKERLIFDLAMIPDIGLSNLDKIFWPKKKLSKQNLLTYIREIYPYMIPYLRDRALTMIRCPDGVEEECFFQKNLPTYAPEFVEYVERDDKRQIICNKIETLIWMANHSTIEYHIPFQTIHSPYPTEIVFDLDPPHREKFHLAVLAAKMIKQMLDELELVSFIKTSGNKGLQIHIPLPKDEISYEETAVLTEAIAKAVENTEPHLFTTERMKKNRGEKLYIDYVQHGKNKTIIAPYSPRMTDEATVATPLYWEEVDEELHPTQFTIENVVERVHQLGCPWLFQYEKARKQSLKKVKQLIGK